MNDLYSPRFKTAEGAKKALYHGDFSEMEVPFELKHYEGIGDRVVTRKEYEDAPYEIRWITTDCML